MTQEEQDRLGRLQKLRDAGVDPYPSSCMRTHMAADFLETFTELEQAKASVTLAGRIRLIRRHGGLTFLQIQDGSSTVQIALKKDVVGDDVYEQFHTFLDVGDFFEAAGTAFLTKKGEPTLMAQTYRLLAKSLLSLPEKWHGLSDIELRYRERELDLIVHPEVRKRFITRSKLVSALRRFLDERGFMEVETPMLQPIPGGANARPFVTHHNALDEDFYLRIAPEIYLKRLIIGGFEKVYEVGRSFRNEGIDYSHNPEFTSIELYWAFVPSGEAFVAFLEEIMRHIVQESIGSLQVSFAGGVIDFSKPWKKTSFREAIFESCKVDIDQYSDEKRLCEDVAQMGLKIDFSDCVGLGEHYDQLFKKTAREAMTDPTWVFDYPLELKPLANVSPHDAKKSASVQLIVHGVEIINAYYHELNDPLAQRERFVQQQGLREQGSEVAQPIDETFLRAMAHGMPPTSGMAIGIDRLMAFLTDAPNLKEVILFPTLRPERPAPDSQSQHSQPL